VAQVLRLNLSARVPKLLVRSRRLMPMSLAVEMENDGDGANSAIADLVNRLGTSVGARGLTITSRSSIRSQVW